MSDVRDETNSAAVKAPSTAPVAADAALVVALSPTSFAAAAESLANPTAQRVLACSMLFNGLSWDRVRGNFNESLLGALGALTASGNIPAQTNFNARGAVIVITVGSVSGGSPTLVFKLQDSADDGATWGDIPGAATPAISAVGRYVLRIMPGITVVANASVSYPLPRTWRIAWTIGGGTPSFNLTGLWAAYLN